MSRLRRARSVVGLQPAEIGKLIGMPSASRHLGESISNPVVRGILDRLESSGRVRQKKSACPLGAYRQGN